MPINFLFQYCILDNAMVEDHFIHSTNSTNYAAPLNPEARIQSAGFERIIIFYGVFVVNLVDLVEANFLNI